MIDQSETHPGAVVNPSDRADMWREICAKAWRAIEHAQTADECQRAIATMGNAGPER